MYDSEKDAALCNECGHAAEDHDSNPDGIHGGCNIRARETGQPCDCTLTREEINEEATKAILRATRPITVTIDVPEYAWEFAGEDYAHAAVTLTICGCPMHLDAYAVDSEPDAYGDTLGYLESGFGGDGPFQTVTIAGRKYALFASPHCD